VLCGAQAFSPHHPAPIGQTAEDQGRRGRPGRKACAEDATRLRVSVNPGEGRIAQCLKAQMQVLSSSCAETVQQRSMRLP